MKLPDFYLDKILNDLKALMGMPANVYGNLVVNVGGKRLTPEELERLISPDGLDITSLNDLEVLDDGTLAYKDSRVILYIRDVTVYQSKPVEPRFHLSNCRTLQQMRSADRIERYVISTRVDGKFKLNLIDSGRTRQDLVQLSVCQNCLDSLHFENFSLQAAKASRLSAVAKFTLSNFFKLFPRSLHIYRPQHDSDNAPLNDYSSVFPAISLQVKQTAQWRCQDCRIDLSQPAHRAFLHTHHKNAIKSDNRPENLKAVCMQCHANQPSHSHMKSLPRYIEFIALKRLIMK
jgi:hypothetical protein